MTLLPWMLWAQYMRPPWTHWVFLALETTGRRLVALVSSHFDGIRTSDSPWHGSWVLRRHRGPFSVPGTEVWIEWMHWPGDESRLRWRAFHLHEFHVWYNGGAVQSLQDAGYDFWPGNAVVYDQAMDSSWFDDPDHLQIIIVDRDDWWLI